MANETDEQASGAASASAEQAAPKTAAQKRAAEKAARAAEAAEAQQAESTEAMSAEPDAGPGDAPAPASDEPTFALERLLGAEGQQITGHEPHVLAGALHDTNAESLTREQVQQAVDAFLARPVKQED